MKIFALIIILIFSNTVWSQKIDEKIEVEKEKFMIFISQFDNDPNFQLDRIKFPLKRIFLDGEPKLDSSLISNSEWRNKKLKPWNKSYRTILYDNFEKKLKDSNERVISFQGIENCYNKSYYFKCINGKWYLVKIEDLTP